MLANYTYELGAVTPVGYIIEHAAQAANENTAGSALSSTSLGFIVKDSWGNAVIRARRGRLLLRVEEHRTRHQNGMGKRETLSLIYDKCMQRGSLNRDKLMH